jgi:hypothetical protein
MRSKFAPSEIDLHSSSSYPSCRPCADTSRPLVRTSQAHSEFSGASWWLVGTMIEIASVRRDLPSSSGRGALRVLGCWGKA